MFLGIKPQRFINGSTFFMCDVLLPTAKDCIDVVSRAMITKDV